MQLPFDQQRGRLRAAADVDPRCQAWQQQAIQHAGRYGGGREQQTRCSDAAIEKRLDAQLPISVSGKHSFLQCVGSHQQQGNHAATEEVGAGARARCFGATDRLEQDVGLAPFVQGEYRRGDWCRGLPAPGQRLGQMADRLQADTIDGVRLHELRIHEQHRPGFAQWRLYTRRL